MNVGRTLLVLVFFAALPVWAESVDVVADVDEAVCEEYQFNSELRVYKDPSLFMEFLKGLLTEITKNPRHGWRDFYAQNPLLVGLKGKTFLMKLGPPRPFKGFGEIAALYEMADPKFKGRATGNRPRKVEVPNVIPVRICGMGSAYAESLGFVLETDLDDARREEKTVGARRPPSTVGNPILPIEPAPSAPMHLP